MGTTNRIPDGKNLQENSAQERIKTPEQISATNKLRTTIAAACMVATCNATVQAQALAAEVQQAHDETREKVTQVVESGEARVQLDLDNPVVVVPAEVAQGDAEAIFTYLKEHIGAQFDKDTFEAPLPAPLPLIGVVPKGHENDTVALSELKIPSEVTNENLSEVFETLLIERPLDSEQTVEVQANDTQEVKSHIQDWKAEIATLQEKFPEVADEVIASLNAYFEGVKQQTEVNPLLVERAMKSIATIQTRLNVDPTLEKTTKLNLMADIYYLLAALDVDVSGAQELKIKGGQESYIVIAIDKAKALRLAELGIDLPMNFIEDYNETYAHFIDEGRKLGDKGPDKPNRFTKFEEKFDSFSLDEKFLALRVYDLGAGDEEAKKPDGWLAVNAIKMLERVNNLRYVIENQDLRDGDTTKAALVAKSIVGKFPSTSEIITPDFINGLEVIYEQATESIQIGLERSETELARSETELARSEAELEKTEAELEKAKEELRKKKELKAKMEFLLALN